MTVAPSIDLLAPASFANGQPHDQFAWLRNNVPVYHHPEPASRGFWAVTRYDDVRTVSRDAATYSSWLGGIMIGDEDPETLAGMRLMMLFRDPPDHTRYRQLVSRAFTPRAVAAWDERLHGLAADIVDAVIEQGHCDLVADLAGEMPSSVIADLMGISRNEGRRLYHLTEIMHSADPDLTDEERMGAIHEMLTTAARVAATKRDAPADDLATSLVHARIGDDQLTDDEFHWFFLLLVNAGGDTTRNLVAGGIEALLAWPGQAAALAASPETLMPTAVEELLRYVSPVVHMRRTASRDCQLGGQTIAAGDKVVVFYGSANRDERVFSDGDCLDLTRNPNPHVAFGGGGPHFCLGSHFARLETGALLGQIVTRMADLQMDGPPERLQSNFIAGPRAMRVRFRPGPRRRNPSPAPIA